MPYVMGMHTPPPPSDPPPSVPPMPPSVVDEDTRERVRTVIEREGILRARAILGAGREQLARIVAGMPVRPGTVMIVISRLDAAEAHVATTAAAPSVARTSPVGRVEAAHQPARGDGYAAHGVSAAARRYITR